MVVIKDGEDAGGSADSGRPRHPFLPRRTLVALKKAKKEGKQILTDEQYWYLVGLVYRPYDFADQEATSDLTIRKYRDFWEFQVDGGFIRNLSLSVFFAFVPDRNEVVVLMVYERDEGKSIPPYIYYLLEDRFEDYLREATQGASVYTRRDSDSHNN
jgi:hypothetical protein